ncbi:hypothetical protein JCM8097_004075 [Rhodosporidiobolus ruineniae]
MAAASPALVDRSALPPLPTLPDPLPDVTRYVHAPHQGRLSLRRHAPRFLHTLEGRDAALRLLQYSLRILVYLRPSRRPKSRFNLTTQLLALVSFISAIRRIAGLLALLGRALYPAPAYPELYPSLPAEGKRRNQGLDLALLRAPLETLSLLFDNLYLFARLRLLRLSPRTTRRADKASDVFALLATVVGGVEARRRVDEVRSGIKAAKARERDAESRMDSGQYGDLPPSAASASHGRRAAGSERETAPAALGNKEHMTVEEAQEARMWLRERVKRERRRMERLRGEMRGVRWEVVRVVCEGMFNLYDALDLQTAAEGAKAWSGLISSGIEFAQTWSAYATAARTCAQAEW